MTQNSGYRDQRRRVLAGRVAALGRTGAGLAHLGARARAPVPRAVVPARDRLALQLAPTLLSVGLRHDTIRRWAATPNPTRSASSTGRACTGMRAGTRWRMSTRMGGRSSYRGRFCHRLSCSAGAPISGANSIRRPARNSRTGVKGRSPEGEGVGAEATKGAIAEKLNGSVLKFALTNMLEKVAFTIFKDRNSKSA